MRSLHLKFTDVRAVLLCAGAIPDSLALHPTLQALDVSFNSLQYVRTWAAVSFEHGTREHFRRSWQTQHIHRAQLCIAFMSVQSCRALAIAGMHGMQHASLACV